MLFRNPYTSPAGDDGESAYYSKPVGGMALFSFDEARQRAEMQARDLPALDLLLPSSDKDSGFLLDQDMASPVRRSGRRGSRASSD